MTPFSFPFTVVLKVRRSTK